MLGEQAIRNSSTDNKASISSSGSRNPSQVSGVVQFNVLLRSLVITSNCQGHKQLPPCVAG